MADSTLSWRLIDDTAAELGANADARMKWRQRGVPANWRIKIVQALLAAGIAVALADFDRLELKPGRIAA